MKSPSIACAAAFVLLAASISLAAQDQPVTVPGPATVPATPAPAAESKANASAAALGNNYAAAQKRAAEAGKDLLLIFTGSDWIKICQLYERDILSQLDFFDPVSQQFEIVLIDFPKEQIQSPALRQQNQLLLRAYRINAFPSVVLTDSDGRPYAFTGYQALSPGDYAKIILSLRNLHTERDKLLGQAGAAQGLEKAGLIAKSIPKLPGNLAARYYRAELEEIIKLDPNDETGKVGVCKKLIADVVYADRMAELSQKVEWLKMVELTDNHIRDLKLVGPEMQRALFNKVGIYDNLGNFAAKIQTLLDIEKIDPASAYGAKARKVLDGMRADRLQEQLAPE